MSAVRRLWPLTPLLLVSGCYFNLAQMPPDKNPEHLQIEWRRNAQVAAKDSKETGKPILLVGAAGHITGSC